MADETKPDPVTLQADVACRLFEHVGDRLCDGFVGLKWSPNMPEDDPYADFLVVDAAGTEYVLEIDVTLWKPSPAARDIGDTHQRL